MLDIPVRAIVYFSDTLLSNEKKFELPQIALSYGHAVSEKSTAT